MKKFKITLAFMLTLSLIMSLSTTAFAATDDVPAETVVEEYVMTAGYNPFANNSRSIIGDDDRDVIDDTSTFPYSAISYLQMTFADGCSAEGTGFMVSANCMLTAGHCFMCEDHGSYVNSMTAYFGYESTSSYLASITATADNAIFYTDPNYTGSQKNYDYGYVIFETNIGNTTGWFGLSAKADSALEDLAVDVSGYRYGVLYQCDGTISSVASKRLKYDADTEAGESGCPVYIYGSTYGHQAVAIHTHGTGVLEPKNSGWRITSTFINTLDYLGYVDKVE